MSVVEKAINYLHTVFTQQLTEHPSLIHNITVVAVNEPPEPYCVSRGIIFVDRDQLIGEKDFAHTSEFYHMICFCLAFQYYGVLIQPLAWSDSWICIGISSYLALEFIESVFFS